MDTGAYRSIHQWSIFKKNRSKKKTHTARIWQLRQKIKNSYEPAAYKIRPGWTITYQLLRRSQGDIPRNQKWGKGTRGRGVYPAIWSKKWSDFVSYPEADSQIDRDNRQSSGRPVPEGDKNWMDGRIRCCKEARPAVVFLIVRPE